MKSIYQFLSDFTKKSFGQQTNNKQIVDVQEDEPTLWSRQMDYSQRPHIQFNIKESDIYNDLNQGRE